MNTNTNNTFDQYNKAMDIVTAVLGEDLVDMFQVSVVDQICKITVPMYVSLISLAGRCDVTILLKDTTSEILVH